MGSLSVGQRKRLAKEARRLAYECVDGIAPKMGRFSEFHYDGTPCCAAGHVMARSGIPLERNTYLWDFLGSDNKLSWWVLTRANDGANGRRDMESRLVFPLLALADALEEAQP